jgi:hypothetical protein
MFGTTQRHNAKRSLSVWSSLSVEVLLGYRFESLCDRIALGHERSKLIALEQGCSRKKNMQAVVPSHSYESYDLQVSYVLGLIGLM